jgi:hypothetical protein
LKFSPFPAAAAALTTTELLWPLRHQRTSLSLDEDLRFVADGAGIRQLRPGFLPIRFAEGGGTRSPRLRISIAERMPFRRFGRTLNGTSRETKKAAEAPPLHSTARKSRRSAPLRDPLKWMGAGSDCTAVGIQIIC